MKPNQFYTQNGWAGSNYDDKLTTKEIAAKVRAYARKNFPAFKFSVKYKWSMYADSLYIEMLEGPCAPYVAGSRSEQHGYMSTMSSVDAFKDEITPDVFAALQAVTNYAASFRYDDSDGMIDYFDTNFYLTIKISIDYKIVEKAGKKEQKAIQPAESESSNGTQQEPATVSPASVGGIEIVEYSEKAIAVFGNTKEMREQLKELGGRFNSALKYNGEKRAGWVFSKKRADEVRALVGDVPAGTEPESIENKTEQPEECREAAAAPAYIVSASMKKLEGPRYVASPDGAGNYTIVDRMDNSQADFSMSKEQAERDAAYYNSRCDDKGHLISGEYQRTELDRQKERADILLQAIDGDYYTICLQRAGIELPAAGVHRYSGNVAAVTRRVYEKLNKRYNVLCDF